MEYHDDDIEFANRLLSDREGMDSDQINDWLNDSKHVKLLGELSGIYRKYSELDFKQETEKELARLKQAITARKRRQMMLRWSVAASIIFLIGLFVVNRLANEKQDPEEKRILTRNESIIPGVKAELVLATGEKVSLGKRNEVIGGTRETGILNDSLTGLNYATATLQGEPIAKETVYNTLNVPVGGFYPLTLADGTKVWLNSVTKLRYPVNFTGEERKVYLEGEAYFEVTPDKKHPFIVAVQEMEVKVYGTEFNVNTFKPGIVQTVLINGKVGVKINRTGDEQMMKPNEMLEFDSRKNTIHKMEVDPSFYTAWKTGEFMFKNVRLEEIMEQFSRWYGVKIVYADEEVKNRTFTGNATRFEDIRDILRIIEKTATVSFTIKDNTIIVNNIKNNQQ